MTEGQSVVRYFSALNLQLLAVHKNAGPVNVRMGDCNVTQSNTSNCFSGDQIGCDPTECCCVKVEVTHRGSGSTATKRLRTTMKNKARVLSVVSSFDPAAAGMFECPQSDIKTIRSKWVV